MQVTRALFCKSGLTMYVSDRQASNSCFVTVLKSSPVLNNSTFCSCPETYICDKPECLVKSISTIDVTLKNKHTDQTLEGSIGVLLVSPEELQTQQPNPFQSTLLISLQGPSLLVSTSLTLQIEFF